MAELKLKTILDVLGKARLFHGHLILPGGQDRQAELAGLATGTGVGEPSVDVPSHEFGIDDDRTGFVSDHSEDFGSGLGSQRQGQADHKCK